MSRHPLANHPVLQLVHWVGVVLTAFFPAIGAWVHYVFFGQTTDGTPITPQVTNMWSALAAMTAAVAPVLVILNKDRNERRRQERKEESDRLERQEKLDAERREREWNLQERLTQISLKYEDAQTENRKLHGRVSDIEDTATVAATQAAVNKTELAGVTGQVDAVTQKLQEMGFLKAPTAAVGQRGPRPTVLIVEDEDGPMEALNRWFTLNGYSVTKAATIEKALLAIEKGPHWAVLDLHVGSDDGLEVLRKIRTDGRQTKVVIITGVDDPERLDEARQLGARGVFVKPIDKDELFALMGQEQGR